MVTVAVWSIQVLQVGGLDQDTMDPFQNDRFHFRAEN